MVSNIVQCASGDCDDIDIMDVNLSGDITDEEDIINKQRRSQSFEGASKD